MKLHLTIKTITEPDFIVEMLGNTLIIGNEKPMECESAKTFTDFLNRIMGIL
jgi:hypothetical protein